ncbi:hypothetical protein RJ53_04705 [Methanocalculus chunghsingensis]|uniref:Uncharacterized protein n=1 Tax=Methanocalculus chunghsingensis TaxID=156457 RepID=A0A8J8B584_9EURY|nr:cohesin domain-containing protein [Methanocalculus chunghsingensis]MBR1368848.1 hypothetical protein [Methanocalculus chunghsingensis]
MGELQRFLAVAVIICCLIGVAYAGANGNDTEEGGYSDPPYFVLNDEYGADVPKQTDSTSLQALIDQNSDATIRIGSDEVPAGQTVDIPVSVANVTGVEGVGFLIFFESEMVDIEDVVVAPGLPSGTLVTYNVTHFGEEDYGEEYEYYTGPGYHHESLLRVAVTIPSETPLNIGATPQDIVLITVRAESGVSGEAWLDFNWAEWSHGFDAVDFDWEKMHSGVVTILPPELPDLAVHEIISPDHIKKYKNGTIMMDPTFVIRNVGRAPVNQDFKIRMTFVDRSENWELLGYTIPVNSNFTIYTAITLDPSSSITHVRVADDGPDYQVLEITHGVDISTGMKKIAIEINPEPRAFEEIRYDNNYHEMQAWVTYPDLVPVLDTTLIEGLPSSQTVINADVIPGTHRVTYGVSNDGDVSAVPTYLRVARDGVNEFISVPALAPGENWTASETIQLDKTKGTKTYTVEVNSRGQAQEEPTERILYPDQGQVSKTITSEFASFKPVTVILPHVTGASAEIKDVPVVLSNVSAGAPVRSFSIPVTYDPTVCRYVGSAPATGVTVTNPGYGRLLVEGTNVNYATDTTVATLRFQAQSEAGRTADFGSTTAATVRTDNNNFLELEITGGTFTQDRVTDARVSLWAPTSGPVDSTVSLSVSVWNTKATPVNVSANVTTGGAVLWEQDEIALGAYQSRYFTVNTWQPDTAGQQTLTATIAGDDNPAGNVATRSVRIDSYNLEITNQNEGWWEQYYGYNRSVVQGNSVMLGTYYTANQPGQVNGRLRMWGPDGTEIDLTQNNPIQMNYWNPAERTFYGYQSTWNSAIWYSIVPRELGTFTYSIELDAKGESDFVNGTLVVREPFVDIKVLRSTALDGTDAAGEINFEIFNRNPSEGREITITASAGAEGRTLQGLEYLIGYPHGCPEQTMSPAFAALRVKQYYAEHDGLTDSLNASVRRTMDQAFDRMKATSTANPQRLDTGRFSTADYGAWAWGTTSAPSLFYTLQPNYVFSELKKDMINDPGYWNVDIFNTTEINLSASTLWLIDQQIETGTHEGGWHSWGYISNRYEWTGFISEKFVGEFEFLTPATQVLVNQSLNRSADYLLTDGKDTPTTKALAFRIFGLHAIKEHYSDDQALVGEIDDKIPELRDALIADRKTDAAGNFYWEDGWYAESEATAYAILALNRSGLSTDDENIAGGLRYLISQYDSNGRWGNTRATGAVVNTLMELQVKTDFTFTANVGVNYGGNVIRAPETLTFDNANVRHSFTLTPQQVDDLYGDAVANRLGTIAITGKSDAGPDAVKMVVAVQSFEKVPLSVARATFGEVARIPEVFIDPIATDFFLDVTIPVADPAGLEIGDDVDVVFTVDNTGPGNINQTVMIIEIPISAGVNFTGADTGENSAYYLSNPSDPVSKVYLSHMVNRTAGRLYVYPGSDDESQPSIVAGEIKNFYVPLRFGESGSQTVEARVYPMYDDEWMAVGDATATIRGFGTLTVSAVDEDGDPVNADFYVNDISVGTGVNTTTIERIEDTYNVAIYGTGVDRWLNTTLRVNTGEVTDYSAQFVTDTGLPHITTVTGAAGDVLVMPPEIEETISETSTNHWNAAVTAKQIFNSTISSSGGIATIAVDVPTINRTLGTALVNDTVTFSYRNVTGWQGPFDVRDYISEGVVLISDLDTGQIDQIILTFEGRPLGDVDGSGTVTILDARDIAWSTVGSKQLSFNDRFYADVQDTGMVTILDARDVAWYTVGERDRYYQ